MRRLVLASTLLLGACAGDANDESRTVEPDAGSAIIVTTTSLEPTTTTIASIATSSPVVEDAPAASTSTPPAEPVEPAASTTTATTLPQVGNPVVDTVVVAKVNRPVDLKVRAGDDALYVVEQRGSVVRIDGDVVTTVADLGNRTEASGEQGLLGLAFAPDGATAFLNYTDVSGNTVIAEYPVATDGSFDVTAERVVISVDQPYPNHNAGDLAFGPDGMLYIPLGDGGRGGDPQRRSSDPQSLLGSLLRIDPSGGQPYAIPPDNPFAAGGDGAAEVWAWGLRNPWKIAFDPVTDELWIADVGQNEFEEINVVAPIDGFPAGRGADFGWSAYEGFERFNTDVPEPVDAVPPVLTYEHGDDGCSISGGVPYRGTAIPELAPAFVYSDHCSGKLWALDLASSRNLTLLEGFLAVTAVRADADGEIYVLEKVGNVHRLIAG